MPDPLLDVEIVARHDEAEGIVSLDLAPAPGATLPPFEPGAHIDVHIAPGLVRPYSLCNDPAHPNHYRLGILLDPATTGGSAAIHATLHPGHRLQIGAPRNHFPLAPGDAPAILLAGGIGITPLLAMAHHLDAQHRPFALHYAVRSRAKAAFLAELARFGGALHLHADDGPPGQRLDPARDLPPPETGAHLYICGPTGFIDWLIAAARARGYDEPHIHREYFGADPDTSGGAFEVVLRKSGRTIPVAPGQTIVQALHQAGIRVDVFCEEGVCGTCLCDVLDGIPDHRDTYLTDDEKAANDQILLCCSRAHTPRLVLDR